MIKKIVAYTFLFIVALLCFLLAMMPAQFVWEKGLKNNLDTRKIGVSVNAVDGTLWDGRALVKYKTLSTIVDWEVKPTGLLSLSLPVELRLESEAGKADLVLVPGMGESEILIKKADIVLSELNPLLRRERVTLDGDLFIKGLRVLTDGERVTDASGLASWSGGKIAYPAQRSVHERDMPAFQLKVGSREGGEIHAGIRDSGGSFDVIEASLSPAGEALVQVKRRLLDIADEHWPSNSQETDTVFKVKKKLF